MSFNGSNYGCNPKAISDFLLQNYSSEINLFWAFSKKRRPENIDKRIKTVVFPSIRYFWVAATAKIIIHNTNFYTVGGGFVRKNNQFYLQTWHGTALKKIEKDVEATLSEGYVRKAKEEEAMWSVVLSGSKYCTNTIKNSFWYSGKVLETGMPRNDVFFNDDQFLREKIFAKYGIKKQTEIVFFCPTFRESMKDFTYNLNTSLLLDTLSAKFGGNWKLLVRLHPNIMDEDLSRFLQISSETVNVTHYPDIQELLYISNILITDYSSVMFDFMLTKRPVFLYANDGECYDRGTYLDIKNLPFPFSENNEKLAENINRFSMENYAENLQLFENKVLIPCEDGSASQRAGEIIMEQIGKE
jgi:CDP-glycerol glycerophosphotransferase